MLPRSKTCLGVALAAGFLLSGAAGAVAASRATGSEVAVARMAWAERHVEFVCRPLEARGLERAADRCYDEAGRVSRAAMAGPEATGSLAPAEPMLVVAPPRRCSGVKCLEMFSSLGVGF